MRTLGILGGMGPMAGAYFYERVIANTDADQDGGHLPVVLFADPRIPDRSTHLIAGGADPLPFLISGVEALQAMRAEVIAIPCNTAHAYLPRMPRIPLPVADMPRLAVAAARSRGARRLGLLSTRGTVAAGVYHTAAEERSCGILTLPWETNAALEALIYRQKAGEAISSEAYLPYVRLLLDEGADAVILGCTEISVAFSETVSLRIVDALEALAREAVLLCGGRIKEKEGDAHNDIRRAIV